MTTVPQVKTELTARLTAALDPESIPVYRALPDRLAGESFAVVGKARASQEWAAIGGRRRTETYRIGVVFQVGDLLDDVTETSDRAYRLLGLLEDLLRKDPTLGGLAVVAELEDWEDDELPADKGFVVLIGATVLVKARTGVTA